MEHATAVRSIRHVRIGARHGGWAGHFDLQLDGKSGALEKLNALLPEMNLPALHGVRVSAHLSNGVRPGDLPVVGETSLRFANADLRDQVPGLTFEAVEASLPVIGGEAQVVGKGRYSGIHSHCTAVSAFPYIPKGRCACPSRCR